MQEILTYIVLGVAVIAAGYFLLRAFRKPNKCNSCTNCPLTNNCDKKNK